MNARELLARLNVPAVRYEMGRGGIPEMTNIDIAGALGMVRNQFGRDVLTAIWWPDGAALTQKAFSGTVRRMLLEEYATRERAVAIAKLELHMAKCEEIARKLTDYDKQIMEACVRQASICAARRWPWNAEIYASMYPVILEDLRRPRLCPNCAGRKNVKTDVGLVEKCPLCAGTGIRHEPNTWRATQLGISESAFRKDWAKVYDWLYRILVDAETSAAYELRDAMEREAA